ncbi:MAG: biotin/lipoyl-containing protein, partial [Actinomycetes bacterium]
MTLNKFNLPDVGEGLTEAEIVSWKVKPGDTVAINDVLCEIETAKSIVELPSPFAGTVTELLVAEGVTVDVGTAIISVSDEVAGDPTPADVRAPEAPAKPQQPAQQQPAQQQPVYGKLPEDGPGDGTDDGGTGGGAPAGGPLVGSGPKADAVKRRPRISPGSISKGPAAAVTANAPEVEPVQPRTAAEVSGGASAAVDSRPTLGGTITGLVNRVLAKPPVRKIARDLGIDLADVVATGLRGEVTREDLVSYQAQRDAELDQADGFWGKAGKPQDQRLERIPVKGVRKATAKAMVDSAFTAPHVSIFVDVDASRTMEFVKRLKTSRDFEGIKVSPLLIL